MNNESSRLMIEVADRDNLPADHPMRVVAKELEDALTERDKQKSSESLKPCLNLWKKAGQVWRDYHKDRS